MKKIGLLLMFLGLTVLVLLIYHILTFGVDIPLLLFIGFVEGIGLFTMGKYAYKR
jgi:hypothetical protein